MSTERDDFEAWYCRDAASKGYPAMTIAQLRKSDAYGAQRIALNSKWEGWQARAALAAPPIAQPVEPAAPEQIWSEWEGRYESLSGGWCAWRAIQAIELDGWQRRTKAYPTQYEMRWVDTKGATP